MGKRAHTIPCPSYSRPSPLKPHTNNALISLLKQLLHTVHSLSPSNYSEIVIPCLPIRDMWISNSCLHVYMLSTCRIMNYTTSKVNFGPKLEDLLVLISSLTMEREKEIFSEETMYTYSSWNTDNYTNI